MSAPIRPLLPPGGLEHLRAALAPFTVDGVDELLGPVGRAAHQRGDLAGVARAVRLADTGPAGAGPVAMLTRLFLLGSDLADRDAALALEPLGLDAAVAAGIVEQAGDRVRALVELRPYAEAGADGEPWWVVSDLGSDVRPGPLARDHVLGIGNAAVTLAQATLRDHIADALDIGTGCGVQALHLSRHAARVTATDTSVRALRFAATTAALSGHAWDLRQGSFTDPVADDRFELVVANPPFVISPGDTNPAAAGAYDYRDSGRAGDAVCRDLVRDVVPLLRPGGTAQLLANWIVPADGSWQDRLAAWFPPGVTAWVWQREVADLGEYVALWLRDAGQTPGDSGYADRYDAWLDWFGTAGVAAVGMGLITMQRTGADDTPADTPADVVCDDVPQPVAQPIGAEIAAWFERRRYLKAATAQGLPNSPLHPAPGLVHTRHEMLEPQGAGEWAAAAATLRQTYGMRWEVEVDDTVASIVAACGAGATPDLALEVLAAMSDDDPADLGERFGPVLRDLMQRGFLLPGNPGQPS